MTLGHTKIPYLERLWHPSTGCSGQGCPMKGAGCWAEELICNRLSGTMKGLPIQESLDADAPRDFAFAPTFHPDRLADPLKARKPCVMGVSFLGDLFDPGITDEQICFVNEIAWMVERDALGHRLIFLTKQAKRLKDLGLKWPACCWMGVSVTNQADADARIPLLTSTSAAHRWISVEPLVGPVEIMGRHFADALGPLDFMIAGGESGPKARPCHPDWARSLRDQCQTAGVPFNWKQWGEWIAFYDRDKKDPDWRRCPTCEPNERYLNLAGGHGFHGERVVAVRRVGNGRTGRLLDGVLHDALPWRIER